MKKLFYGALPFAALMLLSTVAFAQADHAEGGAAVSVWIPIGVGLTLGLAALGSALGQGYAASAALEGIARNPSAAGKIQVPMILALAFMEALTIFSWLVASGMAGKI